ncbi:sugar phosphate isomerase/epimerase family protein [Halocalculus aciditolerans]|uniref:Xylose isomerase-like TIM barrel domain-containing protein n=1 Tax=Halocalculus aciditolerans TaxID=1383812 RepID=A0A830FAD7_9EURY|nr:TIM barrel protein [Halocalculus aciditolerans]GGL55465.1 hypothetical protein GCM10009039_12010 [Halocalculus aciditolerans]
MQVAGKCPPTREALRRSADRGFDAVELHLPLDVVEEGAETLAARVEASPVSAVSVHTPHVLPGEHGPLRVADALAVELDAYLVVHTQYSNLTHVPELEGAGFEAAHGYENPPGASVRHLTNLVLDQGHGLVLDTAHLFMAHPDYLTEFQMLLDRHGGRIDVVHLTDSTATRDGVPFGEGDIEMATLCRLVKGSFDGAVVLEVMPDHQRNALRRFREA